MKERKLNYKINQHRCKNLVVYDDSGKPWEVEKKLKFYLRHSPEHITHTHTLCPIRSQI